MHRRRSIGMTRSTKHRDFLNGAALSIGASPPFSRGVARLAIGRRVGSFFFVPVFDNGFSIRHPAWIRLAGMLEAHGSLLFRDKEWSFWLWVLQQRRAAQAETKALFQG